MSAFPWSHPSFSFLTAEDWHELNTRFHRIERLIRMATQVEVDAITNELVALEQPVADIQAGITALENGQDVDLSALKAAADQLSSGIGSAKGSLPAVTVTDPTAPAPVDGSTPAAS